MTLNFISQLRKLTFLEKLIFLLFLTLPFEKFLTVDYAGFTLKPPYLTGTIFLAVFLISLLLRKIKLSFDKFDLLPLLFIVFSFSTIIWSANRYMSFIISVAMLFVVLLYIGIRKSLQKDHLDFFVNLFIFLGVVTALFGLWQFWGDTLGFSQKLTSISDLYVKRHMGFTRIQSTFFEPGFYANFLLIPLFLNFYKIFKTKNIWYIFSLIITMTVFFLTLSRGGFIALAISFALFSLLLLLILRQYWRAYLKIILLILISLGIALLSIFLSSGKSGISNFTTQSQKTSDLTELQGQASIDSIARSYTISAAINSFRKHPFGIGTGTFGSLPDFEVYREGGNLRQTANSIYPEMLAEQGIQGLVTFLIFLLLIFIKLFKESIGRNLLSITLLGSFVAIFIQYASFSTLYLVYVWVFLGFTSFIINESRQREQKF